MNVQKAFFIEILEVQQIRRFTNNNYVKSLFRNIFLPTCFIELYSLNNIVSMDKLRMFFFIN